MAHCHELGLKIDMPENGRKIVLAGNPNVGKSVFFNALTGLYVDVSNYPGTTLEISHGRYGKDAVIDTPGVYGISSFNDEERIARDVILAADVVINVVDAVHLERDLFLTQQIIDTGVPVVMALNMVDEAARQGMEIDVKLLSELLGIPVVPTIAVQKEGLEELKQAIDRAKPGNTSPDLQSLLTRMATRVASQGEALLILEGDPVVAERHGLKPGSHREEIYLARRERVNYIVSKVIREISQGVTFSTRLGRWMLKPVTGVPILALTLYFMYKIIGVFIAGDVVGFTEETLMQGYYEPAIRGLVTRFMAEDSTLGQILIGEFGLLTMTVTYLLGLLLPLVVGFYLILSTLEDSGYLPRIAALVDRVLTAIGLNGRAVIPMILGFGCVTLATIVTRLLGSERERRIAIFLLALAIPCSAQLGVIAGMLANLGASYIALYVLVIFSVLVVVGTLLNYVLPGKSSDLLIDLPPLRMPRINNVLKKTGTKSLHFLQEATPIFALGALLISIFQVTGILEILQNLLAPLTVGWLNLPKESATAFIMGIVRRDFGAAGLTELSLDPMQTLVALITITLFVPCIAAMLVLFKERGKQEAPLVWVGSWVVAFLVGGSVAQLAKAYPDHAVAAVALFFTVLMGLIVFVIKNLKNRLALKANMAKEG